MEGSYAVGAIPELDIPALGADYYTANLNQWLCGPKGTGVLWVTPEKQNHVKPLVTSAGWGLGFPGEFLAQGFALDLTAWLSVPASLAVLHAMSDADVAEYNHSLTREAADVLQDKWGTQRSLGLLPTGKNAGMVAVELPAPLCTVANATAATRIAATSSAVSSNASPLRKISASLSSSFNRAMSTPSMSSNGRALNKVNSGLGRSNSMLNRSNSGGLGRNSSIGRSNSMLATRNSTRSLTRNPSTISEGPIANGDEEHESSSAITGTLIPLTAEGAATLTKLLREQYSIEVPVTCYRGRLFVRVSAQIYNEIDDYQHLAHVVSQLHKAGQSAAAANDGEEIWC